MNTDLLYIILCVINLFISFILVLWFTYLKVKHSRKRFHNKCYNILIISMRYDEENLIVFKNYLNDYKN